MVNKAVLITTVSSGVLGIRSSCVISNDEYSDCNHIINIAMLNTPISKKKGKKEKKKSKIYSLSLKARSTASFAESAM